jgi:hypothetical protein
MNKLIIPATSQPPQYSVTKTKLLTIPTIPTRFPVSFTSQYTPYSYREVYLALCSVVVASVMRYLKDER